MMSHDEIALLWNSAMCADLCRGTFIYRGAGAQHITHQDIVVSFVCGVGQGFLLQLILIVSPDCNGRQP